MEKMTLDQVRYALDWLLANQRTLLENGELSLASMLDERIEAFKIEVIGRVTQDPCTSIADVAHFEGWAI